MLSNTTGGYNTAIGISALLNNIDGSSNVAVGNGALQSSISTNENTAVGASALYSSTTAKENTAIGANALYQVTTGSQNVAIGTNSGEDLTDGWNNVYVGWGAGRRLVQGSKNTFLGDASGFNITAGINNVFVGQDACNDLTGTQNNVLCIGTSGYNLIFGDFVSGDLNLGNANSGTVSILRNLAVAGDLYIDGLALTNDSGTLTWNGTAIGTSSNSPYLYVDSDGNIKFGPSDELFTNGQNGLRQNVSIGDNSMLTATTADGNTAVGQTHSQT